MSPQLRRRLSRECHQLPRERRFLRRLSRAHDRRTLSSGDLSASGANLWSASCAQEPRFELVIVHLGRQRPSNTRGGGAPQALRDRGSGDRQTGRDLVNAQAEIGLSRSSSRIFRMDNLSCAIDPRPLRAKGRRIAAVTRRHPRLGITSTEGADMPRDPRPAWRGIGGRHAAESGAGIGRNTQLIGTTSVRPSLPR